MTIEENICDYNNKIADDLFYVKGLNIFPRDTEKATYETWSDYKDDAIPNELYEEWKRNGRFAKGIVLMLGKTFRREKQGLWFVDTIIENQV